MAGVIPRYPPIRKIMSLRSKLWEVLTQQYHGYAYIGEEFTRMINSIYALMPPATDRDAFNRTVEHLAGVTIDDAVINDLSWRLAGNLHHLKAGMAIPVWTRQLFQEWVPIQVIRVNKARITKLGSDHSVPGAWFDYMVLAGLPAGHTIIKPHSWEYCYHVRTIFGFSCKDLQRYSRYAAAMPNYPMADLNEFYGLRAYALIDPEICRDKPNFREIENTNAFIEYNREIFRRRMRDGYVCPKNYSLEEMSCYRCEAGVDVCSAACHRLSYYRAVCQACKKENWFDPQFHGWVCVDCASKRG